MTTAEAPEGSAVPAHGPDTVADAPGPEAASEDDWNLRALPGGPLAAIEAILMVADEPVPVADLAVALRLPVDEVADLLAALVADFQGDDGGRPRGFELRELAGGWRLYTAPAFADVVGRFVQGGQITRLTQAALETLAVVAYRQPVSRGQISAVRGVNVDGVVRTLSTRGLIAEVDSDPVTGAVLYGTTGYFLERMGLVSLEDLPPLAPFLPEIDVLDALNER